MVNIFLIFGYIGHLLVINYKVVQSFLLKTTLHVNFNQLNLWTNQWKINKSMIKLKNESTNASKNASM